MVKNTSIPPPPSCFFYDADMFDILLCRKWIEGERGNLRGIILHYLRVVGVCGSPIKNIGVCNIPYGLRLYSIPKCLSFLCHVKGMAEAPFQIKRAKGQLGFQRQICCHLTCYESYHSFTLGGVLCVVDNWTFAFQIPLEKGKERKKKGLVLNKRRLVHSSAWYDSNGGREGVTLMDGEMGLLQPSTHVVPNWAYSWHLSYLSCIKEENKSTR